MKFFKTTIHLESSFFLNFFYDRTNAAGCLEAGHSVAGLLKVLEDHSVAITLPPLTSDEIEKVGSEALTVAANLHWLCR